MGSNREIQGYKVYSMLHFCSKFSSSIILEYTSIYYSSPLSSIHSILDITIQFYFFYYIVLMCHLYKRTSRVVLSKF